MFSTLPGYFDASGVIVGHGTGWGGTNPTTIVFVGLDPADPPVFRAAVTAVGYKAGNKAGANSTAVGYLAMGSGNASPNSVAVGSAAMSYGGSGIAIGESAMGGAACSAGGIAIGQRAMQDAGGVNSIAIGTDVLKNGDGASYHNTAVGYQAMSAAGAITGFANTVIGALAGTGITSGETNTLIGYGASANNPITTGTGNTVLGAGINTGGNTTNNIAIGSGTVTRVQFDPVNNWVFNHSVSVTGALSATGALTLGVNTVSDGVINSTDGLFFNTDYDNGGSLNPFAWGTGRSSTIGGTEWMRLTSTGLAVTGALSATTTIRPGGYTVATLPAAGTAGRIAYVTDATAPTYLGALVGGGAVVTPVFYNGASWVSI